MKNLYTQMLRTDPDTVSKAFELSSAHFIYTLYIMMRYHNNIATNSKNVHFHNGQRLDFWVNEIYSRDASHILVNLNKILK